MISKESKIRVLEGFYGVDYLFFDKPLTSVNVDPALAENYLLLKSALSSIMIEMFKIVDHQPIIESVVDAKVLHEWAKREAVAAKGICKRLVLTEAGVSDVKAQVRELLEYDKQAVEEKGIENVIKEEVERKAYSLAIDTLLIAKMLKESKNYQGLNEVEGRLVEDSYKIIRDSLIEAGQAIKDSLK